MAWIVLVIAGILEVVWAIGLKFTHGFTRLWPSVATVSALAASIGCLAIAVRTLPLGTAYAVWTGIGTIGTVAAGILYFREPASALRLACLACIAVGILGLKFLASDASPRSTSRSSFPTATDVDATNRPAAPRAASAL